MASDERRISRVTLSSQIEEAVRSDIIAGTLKPGERLRPSALAQRYGVSPTPLREAFLRLAAENLVEADPRLGITVTDVSAADLRDVYWLRGLLESRALARSMANATNEWMTSVAEAYQSFRDAAAAPARTAEWQYAHRRFHDCLLLGADSPWLSRFVGLLSEHAERYRLLSRLRFTRSSIEEHRMLYEAVVAGDSESAQATLLRHLASTVETLRGALGEPDDLDGNWARGSERSGGSQ